eukprot:scaffold22583_cov106-Cylindrotheca_fusiformis.AAC.22
MREMPRPSVTIVEQAPEDSPVSKNKQLLHKIKANRRREIGYYLLKGWMKLSDPGLCPIHALALFTLASEDIAEA